MDWQLPLIKDIYAAPKCEPDDHPVITQIWSGADHICWRGISNQAAKGATCKTMAAKRDNNKRGDNAGQNYPGFPMIQLD